MKYDDLGWHQNDDFPDDSPGEYAGTHIALIMKWCFIKGWVGDIYLEDKKAREDVEKVVSGKMRAIDFLLYWGDGKLFSDSFTEEGNQFLSFYYGSNRYFDDYVSLFGEKLFLSSEEEHDFDLLADVIEERFKKFALLNQFIV